MGRITSIIVYFDVFPIVSVQAFCYFFFIFKTFPIVTVVTTGYSMLDWISKAKETGESHHLVCLWKCLKRLKWDQGTIPGCGWHHPWAGVPGCVEEKKERQPKPHHSSLCAFWSVWMWARAPCLLIPQSKVIPCHDKLC